MEQPVTYERLDQEWVRLIKEAKELGLTIEDIQHFLHLDCNEGKEND
nr:anti-repressor SinI family protein [Bacillus sp. FJAT-47783]